MLVAAFEHFNADVKTNNCFPRPDGAVWLLMAKEEKEKEQETREPVSDHAGAFV